MDRVSMGSKAGTILYKIEYQLNNGWRHKHAWKFTYKISNIFNITNLIQLIGFNAGKGIHLLRLLLLTLKSMYPFLSISNVLNTWSQNSSAFPEGKNILYMSTNFAGVSLPFGQSCCKGNQNKFITIYY